MTRQQLSRPTDDISPSNDQCSTPLAGLRVRSDSNALLMPREWRRKLDYLIEMGLSEQLQAGIMHYLQLLFPLLLKSEIYWLRSTDNPSTVSVNVHNESD